MSLEENTVSIEIGRYCYQFTKEDVQRAYENPVFFDDFPHSMHTIATAYIISGGELRWGVAECDVLHYINTRMDMERLIRLILLGYPAAVQTGQLDLFVRHTIFPYLPSVFREVAEENSRIFWLKHLPRDWL